MFNAEFAVQRQLRQIRRLVPTDTFQTLVVSLVLTRLDYGNSVLAGLPAYVVCRLQSGLNQSWTWIGFIHGLGWIGLGDWIGSEV